MAKEKQKNARPREAFRVQFNLLGLVLFSAALIAVAGVLSFALTRAVGESADLATASSRAKIDPSENPPLEPVPSWGELLTYDTQLERPQEYIASEIDTVKSPAWIFNKMKLDQARSLLSKCGLTSGQVEQASSPPSVSETADATVIRPGPELIFSLSPETRARLYTELARDPANHYMHFPFCFPGKSFDEIVGGARLPEQLVARVRSLLYRIGDSQYFSDFETVLRSLPSAEERLLLVKALSSQSAVMVRLRIRPLSDVDKLLGYWAWAPGVRFTNLRPLLESLKRMENGSSISLLYFLPPFARERLYTYPLPSRPGDPIMDCHWSTMNFFNATPDNGFSDPAYTVRYLAEHYYQVGKPTRYGDLVFLLDHDGNAVHSAVYIADDIVFTKNGNNFMTPWMLMRLKNLVATYSIIGSPRLAVYRSKNS